MRALASHLTVPRHAALRPHSGAATASAATSAATTSAATPPRDALAAPLLLLLLLLVMLLLLVKTVELEEEDEEPLPLFDPSSLSPKEIEVPAGTLPENWIFWSRAKRGARASEESPASTTCGR